MEKCSYVLINIPSHTYTHEYKHTLAHRTHTHAHAHTRTQTHTRTHTHTHTHTHTQGGALLKAHVKLPVHVFQLGIQVEVLFDDCKWYLGRITQYNQESSEHRIVFDDGEPICPL